MYFVLIKEVLECWLVYSFVNYSDALEFYEKHNCRDLEEILFVREV